MNVAAPAAATLLQALIGPDTAAPADPAAPVAGSDFAMMMAGVVTPPVTPADDGAASDDVAEAGAKHPDDGDEGEAEAPDAVLLEMLAITPPPAPAPAAPPPGGAEVQAPATISIAARDAAAPSATAAAPDPADRADRADGKSAAMPVVTQPATQATPLQPDLVGPAVPPSATSASGVTAQRPSGAATVLRKAIGLLGLRPSIAPIAADAVASAGPAAPMRDAAANRHAHADGETAATTDDGPADVAAIGITPADDRSTAIPNAGPAAPIADGSAERHPRADVAAQLGEHHIALAQGDGWLDQLARDISATAAPDGKLHFRLNPERLGSVHVEVARGAEGAAVRLTADSSATRDILVDAQPQLAAQAQAQGVRIAGTHVDLGAGTGGGSGQGGGRQEHAPVPQVRALGAAAVTAATETAGSRSTPERYA